MANRVNGLLPIALSAAVPLWIIELERAGGPSDEDWREASASGVVLASEGDVLLYGGKKKGHAADLFNCLARSIAVLAFCPGGVRVFGEKYEGRRVSGAEIGKVEMSHLEAFLSRLRSSPP